MDGSAADFAGVPRTASSSPVKQWEGVPADLCYNLIRKNLKVCMAVGNPSYDESGAAAHFTFRKVDVNLLALVTAGH